MLTQQRLKELVVYLPQTGEFISRRAHGPIGVGDVLGHPDKDGYTIIGIDRRSFKAHRLAWLYMRDSVPSETDHLNGVRHDNRWVNLRATTRQQNNCNKLRQPKQRKSGKWAAVVTVRGRDIWLGHYLTEDAARAAIAEGKRRYHPSFARG